MAEVVRMPKMSDTMTEGVIVAWHKKVGDAIKAGDLLAEIETDKAVMEFESFQSGTLLYIGAEKGQTVKVNDVIAVLGKAGEDYKSLLASESTTKKEEKVPAKEEKQVEAKKEEKPTEKKKEELTKAEVPAAKVASVSADTSRMKASPLAKKIAQQEGVPLNKLSGSGDDGRIVKRDVEQFLKATPSGQQFVAGEESYEDVPLSQMRKTVARRLVESKFSAPHFYLTTEINMDRSADMRAQINEMLPDQKISFNDIVIKACALALTKNPKVNSSWLTDKIRYNHHIHIGMAVAVEEGLLVPVIKFANQKSLQQIGAEAKAFAGKAKEKKLQLEEMQGNTFTISNLGMMDIDEFTAIINPPDACILAVGKIKQTPIIKNGRFASAGMMKVTLSCDHRVVDGATGAAFLQTLKSYLENPVSMLM